MIPAKLFLRDIFNGFVTDNILTICLFLLKKYSLNSPQIAYLSDLIIIYGKERRSQGDPFNETIQ